MLTTRTNKVVLILIAASFQFGAAINGSHAQLEHAAPAQYAANDGGSSVCDQGGGRIGPCPGSSVGLKADQAPVSSSVCDEGGGRIGPCAGSGVGLKAEQQPVGSSICDQGDGRTGPCAGSGVGLKK